MTVGRRLISAVPPVAVVYTTTPSFRAVTDASGNGSLSVAVSGSVVVNDLMILAVAGINGGSCSTPAGWTLRRTDTGNGSSGATSILRVFYRYTQGGDAGSSVAPTVSGRVAALCIAYSGVNLSTPFHQEGSTVSSADGTTLTAPSVTTTVAHCRILELWAGYGGAFTSIPATSRDDVESEAVARVAASDQDAAAAGATGSKTATIGVYGPNPWVGTTLALMPAA